MTHPLQVISNESPWYVEGLRFQCTECGACCTGTPGYTWVSEEEIIQITEHLGITIEEFGKQYLRCVDGRYALLEKLTMEGQFDCTFLKDKKCQIYGVRPKQCRTFPWWAQNLRTPEDWQQAAKRCEGISKDAPIVPLETIQEQLSTN